MPLELLNVYSPNLSSMRNKYSIRLIHQQIFKKESVRKRKKLKRTKIVGCLLLVEEVKEEENPDAFSVTHLFKFKCDYTDGR